jgi:predicted dehydrogenase
MVEAVMIGAGQRGHFVYGAWAEKNPNLLRFVAVADPRADRRERFARANGIPPSRMFASPAELFEAGRLGQACVIASPDRTHHDATVGALESGYQVLMEKPMAPSLPEVESIVSAARRSPGQLHVAHVLRYTPFFSTLHGVIASGRLGEIVTVEHRENVVAWHMAHSYVRGNWAKVAESSPMILAKCCHDFDILQWNLPSRVARMASFGNLFHFHPKDAPPGATERCSDPCPVEDCPFDARRIYLNPAWTRWPVEVITNDLSPEGRLAALQKGPYGRCVYTAGSDVVDHQVVAMELEGGTTVTLVMHGHSHEEGRTMRYDGTEATLRGVFGRRQVIEITDHHGGPPEEIVIPPPTTGHGGGDEGVILGFLESIESGRPALTSAEESFESHLLALLAEEARTTGKMIEVSRRRTVHLTTTVSNIDE